MDIARVLICEVVTLALSYALDCTLKRPMLQYRNCSQKRPMFFVCFVRCNVQHVHDIIIEYEEVIFISIRYDKLFNILEQRGYTLNYWLRQNGLHTSTVSKLRKNERVNTDTINTICKLLNVQPGDIMEYIPDADPDSQSK